MASTLQQVYVLDLMDMPIEIYSNASRLASRLSRLPLYVYHIDKATGKQETIRDGLHIARRLREGKMLVIYAEAEGDTPHGMAMRKNVK